MDSKKYKPDHDPERVIPVRKDDDNDFTNHPPSKHPIYPDPTVPPNLDPDKDDEDKLKPRR